MRPRRSRDPFAVSQLPATSRWGALAVVPAPDDTAASLPVESLASHAGRLPALRWRVWLGLIAAGLAGLLLRAGALQLLSGEHYRGLAEGNRLRLWELPAQRGLLFDRFGIPLVRNDPDLQLAVIPLDLPRPGVDRAALVDELAGLLGRPVEAVAGDLQDLSKASYLPVVLAEGLTHDQAIRLRVIGSRFSGLQLGLASRRTYLHPSAVSLSHVLGYLGKISPSEAARTQAAGYALADVIGKSGLELALESELRGQKGREQVEVDATGRHQDPIALQPAIAGADVTLTIDLAAQQALEAALSPALKAARAPAAAAVALDPQSGEVLAIVSLPAFDNNLFAAGIRPEALQALTRDPGLPLFNRVVQGTYPSGSTIKPVVAAAALEYGIITERTTVASTGGIRINQWFFPDWKSGGHGPTNLSLALAESVNTYFYYLGGGYRDFSGLGVQRLTAAMRLVGLGAPTGVGLAGEAAGLVPDPAWKTGATGQSWYIGDTYHLAIGQGDLLVTPLQVANYTAVVANGGNRYQPGLVREVRSATDVVGRAYQPRLVQSAVFAPSHLAAVRRGLRLAVQAGSAKALRELPIAAAGKTGTAQWSSVKPPHAWFTGYAPADDPRVVLTVVVEEGGEGSVTAVPVASRFFHWWAEHRTASRGE